MAKFSLKDLDRILVLCGMISSRFISKLVSILSLIYCSAQAFPQLEDAVTPILKTYCIKCHGAEKQKGKLTLHDIKLDFTDSDTADKWVEVLDQLISEDMPPEDEKQPSNAERSQMIKWINLQLKKAKQGDAYRKKLLAPEYGNWVDHEKLFSGEITTLPYSPSRLWRFSPEIFHQKGFGKARSPFTYITSQTTIRDYSAMSPVDQSTVQMILINADQFFVEREREGKFKNFVNKKLVPSDEILTRTVLSEYRRIVGRLPNDEQQAKYLSFLRKSIKTGGNRDGLLTMIKALFLKPESIYRMEFGYGSVDKHGRRHLSTDELVQTIAFALTDRAPEKNKILWSSYKGGKLKTSGDVARVVRQMLDGDQGSWARPALPRIMRFFEQYFGFDRAGDVFKDNRRRYLEGIRQWSTNMLVHDAQMLIEHILRKDKNVISELLTTDKYFVAHPGNNEYAKEYYEKRLAEVSDPHFIKNEIAKREKQLRKKSEREKVKISEKQWKENIERTRKEAETELENYTKAKKRGVNRHPKFPHSKSSRSISDLLYIAPYSLPASSHYEEQQWNWPVEQPFNMPSGQRAGILTHPAWLAAWSVNDGNDPIHRGIWVYEKLLAGKLQDVPPDVDAKVPIDPRKTLRERMNLLRGKRCWNCHHKINPLGETFEMFDDWGRYRKELFFDEDKKIISRRDEHFERLIKNGKLTTRKINATGVIAGTGDPNVDGPVENAVEMLHRLGKSERVRQSFIRHLFRYFMGRNEMLSDSKTLIAAEQAYLKNGGSFKELVISLLSSDSFLYRR